MRRRSDYLRDLRSRGRKRRNWWIVLAGAAAFCLVSVFIYRLPPVYNRLSPRVAEFVTRIKYAVNPPDEAVFQPGAQADLDAIVQATFAALTPKSPTSTPTPEPTRDLALPTFTPSPTAPPLPDEVYLDGVTYVDQHNRWNYCGPANLAMALNFWGWAGDRDDVAEVIKPGVQDAGLDFIQASRTDKNVMPYEMVDFVNDHTEFRALQRYGGEIEVLKRLIAAGYPVVIEKGYYEADYTGKIAWLGHYLFVTGYSEARGAFIVQDAYLKPGEDLDSPYDVFIEGWRSFNFLYMVIYPPEDESAVLSLLGPWADEDWANRNALAIADAETQSLTGIDQFFAWFNKGTSHVNLYEYVDAAFAYDYAFSLYNKLENDDTQRPFRIMWYQTGPYWAYFYAGRYADVVRLANTTLNDTISEPTLEESIYWRGMAYLQLGRTGDAAADFWETVRLNPNFGPGWNMLQQMGEVQ